MSMWAACGLAEKCKMSHSSDDQGEEKQKSKNRLITIPLTNQ